MPLVLWLGLTHTHTVSHTHTYIYIERETDRQRKRERDTHTHRQTDRDLPPPKAGRLTWRAQFGSGQLTRWPEPLPPIQTINCLVLYIIGYRNTLYYIERN